MLKPEEREALNTARELLLSKADGAKWPSKTAEGNIQSAMVLASLRDRLDKAEPVLCITQTELDRAKKSRQYGDGSVSLEAYAGKWGSDLLELYTAPPAPAAPSGSFDVVLDADEAKTLRDYIGDAETQAVRLQVASGHSGYGLYVCSVDYPDEGSTLVTELEQPAPATPRVAGDALRDAVNALLHQIDIGDFVDSHGHSAKMLKPVHDLMRLLAAAPRNEQEGE